MGLSISNKICIGVVQLGAVLILPDGAFVDPETGDYFVDPETGYVIVDPDPQ